MSSPALVAYRLPSRVEADRILKAAHGKPDDDGSSEVKARRNLCKQLKMAWDALGPHQSDLKDQYKGGRKKPECEEVGQKVGDKPCPIPDDQILAFLDTFLGSPNYVHPGSKRFVPLDAAQEKAVSDTIGRLGPIITAIQSGVHNKLIDQIFTPGNTNHVINVLSATLTLLTEWLPKGVIQFDQMAKQIKAAALTNPGDATTPPSMGLTPSFFKTDKDHTDEDREAELAHEGTHGLKDGGLRTNDKGGYIHEPKFLNKDNLAGARLRNAAHYEYLIRKINGAAFTLYKSSGSARTESAVAITTTTLQNAWIIAINVYLDLVRHKAAEKVLDPAAIVDKSRLMGLSAHKTSQVITDGDLAVAENRVAKLGVMFGAVERAKQSLQAEKPPRAVTKENLLAKLIEMEGALRKSSGNEKTIQMIEQLAAQIPQPSGSCVIL